MDSLHSLRIEGNLEPNRFNEHTQKKEAIWNTSQGYRIERPPNKKLSDKRASQIEEFESALHSIVSNESLLEHLSSKQSNAFKNKITNMVLAFERDLSKSLNRTWSPVIPYDKGKINQRVEGYRKDIEDVKRFLEYMQGIYNTKSYFRDRDEIDISMHNSIIIFRGYIGGFLDETNNIIRESHDLMQNDTKDVLKSYAEKSRRYGQGISDISNNEWLFPDIENRSKEIIDIMENIKKLPNIMEIIDMHLNNILDDRKTKEEVDEARNNIMTHLDWLQETGNKVVRAYAEGLEKRMRSFKGCFDKHQDQLLQTQNGRNLLRSFTSKYQTGLEYYQQTTPEQSSNWMTSEHMLKTFEPHVRDMELVGLNLLEYIYRYKFTRQVPLLAS